MISMWLVVGFVTAVPTFLYITGVALLDKLLKKERPLALVVNLSSRQATQCQANKNGQDR